MDCPVLGCTTRKRRFETVAYREATRERIKIEILADNRRHAIKVAKKSGYVAYTLTEIPR